MATCEVCGNEYDKTFEVRRDGETVEADGRIFCCANCASEVGVAGLTDRA